MQAEKAPERISDNPTVETDVALLVRRARDGDHEAFAAIYRLHVNRVFALCLRLTADRDTASRLTQDAFVRAWRGLSGFRGESKLLTWLHRLTINVVLDHRRNERRDSLLYAGQEPEDGGALQAVVQPPRIGERRDLERAIAGLPTGARTIFVLYEIEGYRMREIADMTGTAVGTVKAQLHRARRLLREVLK